MFQNLFLLFAFLYTTSTLHLPIVSGNLIPTCKTVDDLIPSRALDMEKFQGMWYYQKTFKHVILPTPLMVCSTSNITKFDSTHGPMVSTELCSEVNGEWRCGKDYWKIDQTIFPLESAWYFLNRNTNTTVYPLAPTIWLQTDNEGWALSYDCFVSLEFSFWSETMTLFTRQPVFDNEEVLNVVNSIVQSHGFNKEVYIPSNNIDCAEH